VHHAPGLCTDGGRAAAGGWLRGAVLGRDCEAVLRFGRKRASCRETERRDATGRAACQTFGERTGRRASACSDRGSRPGAASMSPRRRGVVRVQKTKLEAPG
jgi:hypothetical protein